MIIDEANKIALGFQIGEGLQTQSGIQLPEYQISSKKDYVWNQLAVNVCLYTIRQAIEKVQTRK